MKKVAAILLASVMVFCFAGCGKNDDQSKIAPVESNASVAESQAEPQNSSAEELISEDVIIGDVPDSSRVASERSLLFTTCYVSGENGNPAASGYAEIFRKAGDAKYIIGESNTCNPEAFDYNIYSVPYAEIVSLYEDIEPIGLEANEEVEPFANIEKYITLPIANLTQTDGYYLDEETGNQVMVLHNSDSPYEAFGSTIGNDYAAFFETHGLSLKANRVELVSILGESNLADGGTGYATVKADIGCAENSGNLASLEWIPAVGVTEEVTFIVKFNTFILNNDGTPIHMFLIGDIAVL